MKILVFYVTFAKDKLCFIKNLGSLKKYLSQKTKSDYEIISVNNNCKLNLKIKDAKIYNRKNSYFDFGGWDYLLKKEKNKIKKCDWILFTNDTFKKDYKYHLSLFNFKILKFYAGQKYAIGHLDAYTKNQKFSNVRLSNFYSFYWLRTSFIFINPSFFKEIKSVIFLRKKKIFKNFKTYKINNSEIKISNNFSEQIYFWLLGSNSENKISNIYRNVKKNTSLSYLRNKISTIINEFLLSRNLEKKKYKLIDIEWAYYKLETKYTHPKKQINFATQKRLINNIKNP